MVQKFHMEKKRKMINMFNPFSSEYNAIKSISHFNKGLLLFTTIVTLISTVSQHIFYSCCLNSGFNGFNMIVCLCVIAYNCINIFVSFAYIKEEDKRRSDLIDNAMGTKFSNDRTEDYYTNNKSGLLKIAANNFESCLYSYKEITYDYKHYWPKAIVVIVIYVCAALLGEKNVIIALLKLTIPYVVFTKCIKMYHCKNTFERIISEYRKLFGTRKNKSSEKVSTIINLFVKYETTLSWGQILLSEKAYSKLKNDIEKEWDGIRKDFSI